VKTTPCLSPYKLGRLFALKGERVGLGGSEEYGLSVTADEEFSVSGVDSVFRQSAKFSCGQFLIGQGGRNKKS
jgi:hypothetical protein